MWGGVAKESARHIPQFLGPVVITCKYRLLQMSLNTTPVPRALPVPQVVGPVVIPCEYTSPNVNFITSDCTFADADAWHKYAQKYITVGSTAQQYNWVCAEVRVRLAPGTSTQRIT